MPTPAGFAAAEAADPALDWRRTLQSIIHRPWWIVVLVLLSLMLAAVLLKRATPVYTTYTEIKYESAALNFVDFAGLGESAALPNEIETQIEIVRSPRILQRVGEALGMQARFLPRDRSEDAEDGPTLAGRLVQWKNDLSRRLVSYDIEPLDPETLARQRMQQWLASNLRVSQVGNTYIIRIQFADRNRDRAARVADEFARQYILSLQEEKRRNYEEATQWFESQVRDAKHRLEGAELVLHEYKGLNDIRVLEQNLQISQDTMRTISSGIQDAMNRLEELESRRAVAADPELSRALLAEEPRSRHMVDRIKKLQIDRVALVMENTDSHPDVVRISREIEVVKSQMDTAAQELKDDLEADARIQQINLDSLRSRLSRQEELVEAIQREMIQYRVLERDVHSNREMYTSLLDRSKQVAVTSEIGGAAVTILRPAHSPEFPSSPKIVRTLALFGIFGFCAGIGLIMLADRLDRSIKDPRLVEQRLGLATLGTIPFLKDVRGGMLGRGRGHSPLVTSHDPKSVEAESFRVLRTALQYSRGDKPPQVLLLTSSYPQEGKSTLAANLAISYAQRGDRVLLIDCDLKRPTVHRIFDIARTPGLSDVLTGQKTVAEVVHSGVVENLDVLVAGPSTPSPGDLLESRTMTDLLTEFRTRYTMVIVDSAPLAGIADSLVLSRSVDGICLVVNRGKTPFEALGKVLALLDQVEAPVLGVVYNSRSKGIRSMGDPGYSPYGYGYHYSTRTSD